MSDRTHASSGSPFEASIGFSRAIRVGDRILVSGTAPIEDDGSSTEGDAEAQAERCFAIIVRAIEQLGGSAEDVVRTRMLLVDAADGDAVGRAHGRWFADVRPAATMLVVAGLLRPEWRVEIEAEAMLGRES
ncbi:RidA family protein [Sphingomonas sp.]|uniref:RidA family protein n=1 Tax=Sphingomonas sp. TaxID=28214 RepID=UPI002C40D1E6|nr:RidA family protein [Sphingomonas sp.]HWK34690.1 RidA family protein [Sphingomonas sp.]